MSSGSEDTDIEVDPTLADGDGSDYASSGYDTSTQSLTSSINEYIFENGRRYHAYFGKDKNLLPTDETEQDRLDIHHEIFLTLLKGKLHQAPLENPQRILDLGTGTGIWVIDMADKFPEAEVIGTDLSPIQPKWVPPNCRFEVDDMEREWTFREDQFDFIHARNISQGIGNWENLLKEVIRCITPGGYVELLEGDLDIRCDDGTMAADNPAKVWMDHVARAMREIGRPATTDVLITSRLQRAGFVDIHPRIFKQPLGPWPKAKHLKQAGLMELLQCETGFHAYGMAAFTRILGMPEETADKLCRDGYRAVLNKNVHMYIPSYVVYARKPAAAEA